MDLQQLYKDEGRKGLKALADKVGCNPSYLYQLATTEKEPSPRLARALVKADPRLSIDDIYWAYESAGSPAKEAA